MDLGSIPIWYARDDGSEQFFRQAISVTIDGQPLRDSNGATTFNFKLPR